MTKSNVLIKISFTWFVFLRGRRYLRWQKQGTQKATGNIGQTDYLCDLWKVMKYD